MSTDADRVYRTISDYALIGDAHAAALVARDGSIDWCCWPRFDSPAVFCRLLDSANGGCCRVGPIAGGVSSRSYLGPTNVLATTFDTGTGQLRLTDFMPVEAHGASGNAIKASQSLLRLVEGIAGAARLEVHFRPTFDFGRVHTDVVPHPAGAVAQAGRESLVLTCSTPLRLEPDGAGGLRGALQIAAGDRVWISLRYGTDGDPGPQDIDPIEAETALRRTLEYWTWWSGLCEYRGPYHDLVRRSALTLKLLTFNPTGALIAAPTTSLPEELGGVRNWDYRYTWLRDSSLILDALQAIGYHQEALAFFDWLQRLCLGCRGRVQGVYRVDGGAELPEHTLGHLNGYRGSRPVRVGNAAAGQIQLDVYGEVLDAAHLCLNLMPRPLEPRFWDVLRSLADRAAVRWREPDEGIWEVRGGRRHFLYSKLLCWVAVDRAIRLAEQFRAPGDVAGWHRARDEIRRTILTDGYDPNLEAFTQSLGEAVLDASSLAIPLVGFLSPSDPRVRSTVARIQERLTSHGLAYRYLTEDGLPGSEGTFAPCSFWLVENLALDGRIDEACGLFERVVGYANDLGLLSEQIDPVNGQLLGNFPQGFTHLALLRSAVNIARAEALGPERRARTPAERGSETRGVGVRGGG